MTNPANIDAVLSKVTPEYLGFIFFEKSPRYLLQNTAPDLKRYISNLRQKKVGVFVDASLEAMQARIADFALNAIQLCGDCSPSIGQKLMASGVEVLKVVSVGTELPQSLVASWQESCSYFLLDTKTPLFGGSGHKFDWSLLDSYPSSKPFFLSGGISQEDAPKIRSIQHPKLHGIDINSRFEDVPGIKNPHHIHEFFQQLQKC